MEIGTDNLNSIIDDLSTQLAESFFRTVQMLGSIASQLERYYENSHSKFVSDKSVKVAATLGMSETDILEIKIAGLLHDIGKVGFKESFFYRKPNELTEVDYQLFASHPELGMQILKINPSFDGIGEIIYQHHERIDGSGFPRHLRRSEIHPGATIIHVADLFHNTLYKRHRSKTNVSEQSLKYASTASLMDSTKDIYSSAMNYLHTKKGVLFDKKVIEAFTDVIESERRDLGEKSIIRVPVNQIEPGMMFARDYYTSYGLLIASNGEIATEDSKRALLRFAEAEQLPPKILVIK